MWPAASSASRLQAVLPIHETEEQFHWSELPTTDVGDIGCHEFVHFVQLEQTYGFWRGLNWFFGNLMAPNEFTERWFLEGLAQYYEGRLGHDLGRPHSGFYRGMWESGVASRSGVIEPGDLSVADRELFPVSGKRM